MTLRPPWPVTGSWEEERTCSRCGETIPVRWRHFWPYCSCTWTVLGEGRVEYHDAGDPSCAVCGGSGFRPCEPQDLSVLRRWGACAACGLLAVVLVGDGGEVPGSARHADGPEADHEVVVGAAPLVPLLGDYLDRAAGGG